MDQSRLRLLPADVQAALAAASPERLRDIAIACAALALEKARPGEPVLNLALHQLKAGQHDPRTVREVQEVAQRLDDRYLSLWVDADPSDPTDACGDAFRAARAAFSLSAALDQDPRVAAIDAAYELLHALPESDASLVAATAAGVSDPASG